MDYSKGKIYKITDVAYTECYYGATIQPLSKRMGVHRSNYKAYKEEKCAIATSFILFDKYGVDNCKIELVEEIECKSKEELHQREAYWIRNNNCVNKNIPGRTDKEYREDNKEKLKEYNKEYREQNKEKLKEYFEQNREKIKEYRKEYREQNREKIKEYRKEYYEQNREKINEKNKEYKKEYREQNREKLKEQKKEYNSQRVTCDICNKEMNRNSLLTHKKLH